MAIQDEADGKNSSTAPIRALVPMIHVADVERSIEFYRRLGFEVGNSVPAEAPLQWAWLYAPLATNWRQGPNLMVSRSECAIDPEEQVLFYLYATQMAALRDELLRVGLKAGEISYPEYLPNGEFKVEDPDGYCLMIAQAGPDTP